MSSFGSRRGNMALALLFPAFAPILARMDQAQDFHLVAADAIGNDRSPRIGRRPQTGLEIVARGAALGKLGEIRSMRLDAAGVGEGDVWLRAHGDPVVEGDEVGARGGAPDYGVALHALSDLELPLV